MLQNLSFHHIGYAVKDIDATAQFYLKTGWTKSDTILDPIQNTYIAFLYRTGFPTIELVAPVDEQAPICNILKKSGVGTYHVLLCAKYRKGSHGTSNTTIYAIV